MDYRDERDALRARVESLEQQLEEAKRELRARAGADPARVAQVQAHIAEAEAQIHRIRDELAALGGAGSDAPRRSPVVALGLASLLLALGVTGWVVLRVQAAPQASQAAAVQAPARARAAAPTGGYFKDATGVPGAFQAKIGGPVRVLDLVVYDTYAIGEIQDPRNHENLDRYTLQDGTVGDGQPMMLYGSLKTAKDVDATVQDLAAVDFSLLPKMAEEALDRLKIDGGKVTHAILDARRDASGEVVWRVYVGNQRKSGYIEFDTAGRFRGVVQ